jgi:DNA polymerase-3 subunit beta
MKFIISTSALLKELQTIGGIISTNTVLPILEDFLFEIKDGNLTISSSDLETSMSATLAVEAKENEKVAIPAKMLMDTLKSLPEQPLTFSVDQQTYAIEITSENGKYKLAGENGDDFPRIPAAEDVQTIEIPAAVMKKVVSKTAFAVSSDELRPAMTGIFFQLDPDGLTFVATDAHKLVRFKRSDIKIDEATSFIVPRKALALLSNALSDKDNVQLSFNGTNAFFTIGHVNLICRLIDAKYPDYNAVIPMDNPNLLTINKNDFHGSLQRIAIYSNKTTHQIILKITGSELQLSAQDLDFSNEASERLTCKYEGEDIEIGFNAKFLIEMLSAIDTEEVNFQLSTPTRAGLLLPTNFEDNEDILMLVMPVMLNT